MNARHAANDDLPFSYPVKVGHISANPVRIGLEANAEELKALAKFWDVVSVEYLKAELQVTRWKRDGVKIKGEVHAAVTPVLRRDAGAGLQQDRRERRAYFRAGRIEAGADGHQ